MKEKQDVEKEVIPVNKKGWYSSKWQAESKDELSYNPSSKGNSYT